jgi:hypothetical protein
MVGGEARVGGALDDQVDRAAEEAVDEALDAVLEQVRSTSAPTTEATPLAMPMIFERMPAPGTQLVSGMADHTLVAKSRMVACRIVRRRARMPA